MIFSTCFEWFHYSSRRHRPRNCQIFNKVRILLQKHFLNFWTYVCTFNYDALHYRASKEHPCRVLQFSNTGKYLCYCDSVRYVLNSTFALYRIFAFLTIYSSNLINVLKINCINNRSLMWITVYHIVWLQDCTYRMRDKSRNFFIRPATHTASCLLTKRSYVGHLWAICNICW